MLVSPWLSTYPVELRIMECEVYLGLLLTHCNRSLGLAEGLVLTLVLAPCLLLTPHLSPSFSQVGKANALLVETGSPASGCSRRRKNYCGIIFLLFQWPYSRVVYGIHIPPLVRSMTPTSLYFWRECLHCVWLWKLILNFNFTVS